MSRGAPSNEPRAETVPAGAEGSPRSLASAVITPVCVPATDTSEVNCTVAANAVAGPSSTPEALSEPASVGDNAARFDTARVQGRRTVHGFGP